MPAYVYGDKNVTQIVTLNRPAVVRCPAGGHPEPMVHWWRNRSRLPLLSSRFELARDYSLTFRSVQLTDLGPYTCEAWNRLSVRPSSIKVTLVAVGPVRAANNDESEYLKYIIEPPKAPVSQVPTYPYRPTRPPAVPPPYVVVGKYLHVSIAISFENLILNSIVCGDVLLHALIYNTVCM